MARKKKPPPPPAPGPPRRRPNAESRGREYLMEEEVDRLRATAARLGRNGHRDATMILMAYCHALRVSELIGWRWDRIDLDKGTVYVVRKKGSKSGTHHLERPEINALKKLTPGPRDRAGEVFRTDRGGPMSESGFFKVVARAGREAGFSFPVHPHMLRHALGFEWTRAEVPTRVIQDWMGHKNIQHTVRYTELDPEHFRKANPWEKVKRRRAEAPDD